MRSSLKMWILLLLGACTVPEPIPLYAIPHRAAPASTGVSETEPPCIDRSPPKPPEAFRIPAAALWALDACRSKNGVDLSLTCPAAARWTEGRDSEVLTMLDSADPQLRSLAELRGFQGEATFFAARDNAVQLVHALRRVTANEDVPYGVATLLRNIEFEELGLSRALEALASSPNQTVRKALAATLDYRDTPLRRRVIRQLLADSDDEVEAAAVAELWTIAHEGRVEGCRVLRDVLRSSGSAAAVAEAHAYMAKTDCMMSNDELITSIARRLLERDAVRQDVRWASALVEVCGHATARQRARAYQLAATLLRPDWAGAAVIDALVTCDADAARSLLTRFLGSSLSEPAASRLAQLGQAP